MRLISFLAVPLLIVTVTGCGTLTTETTELPFDIASTSGDVASTASGTTGGDEASDYAALRFLETELDWVRRDAARGGGEHLDALAELLGVTDHSAFAESVKKRYAEIFSSDADAATVHARLKQVAA